MGVDFDVDTRSPLQPFLQRLLIELDAALVMRGTEYSDFTDNSARSQALMRILLDPPRLTPPATLSLPFADDTVANGVEMICQKLSRLACSGWHHRDSWLDLAGYALLVAAHQDRIADRRR